MWAIVTILINGSEVWGVSGLVGILIGFVNPRVKHFVTLKPTTSFAIQRC